MNLLHRDGVIKKITPPRNRKDFGVLKCQLTPNRWSTRSRWESISGWGPNKYTIVEVQELLQWSYWIRSSHTNITWPTVYPVVSCDWNLNTVFKRCNIQRNKIYRVLLELFTQGNSEFKKTKKQKKPSLLVGWKCVIETIALYFMLSAYF